MRSAVAQGQQATALAGQTGQQLEGQAALTGQNVLSNLTPIEMAGGTPQQKADALVQQQGESGGALSSVQGQANLMAARNRNPGSQTMALDQAQRQKTAQDQQAALNVNKMFLDRQMQGLGMGAGMYGTQLDAAMRAYGLQAPLINAQAAANQTGWVQNLAQFAREGAAGASAGMSG